MLTMEQIEENKRRFIDIVKSIEVDFDIDSFIFYLEDGDFFYAPATATHSYAYDGGLCQHSLDVYDTLCVLCSLDVDNDLDANSIKVVGLFHDLYKMNYYEKYAQNKKVYTENGSKRDNFGKFEWVSSEAFKIKDQAERLVYGDSAFTSYMILSKFIPLTDYEIVALVNHNCGMDNGYSNKDLGAILNTNKLAIYLHSADMICTYNKPLVDYRVVEEDREIDMEGYVVTEDENGKTRLVVDDEQDSRTTTK